MSKSKGKISEVSYLRGLMEGIKLDESTPEGMLIAKIVDVLEGISDNIADVEKEQALLRQVIDEMEDDLIDLQETVYGDDDDYDDDDDEEDDDDDFECEGDCEGCPGCDEDDEYDGDILVECLCPECRGHLYVRESELDEEALHICPHCGARIHVVTDYEDDIPIARLADAGEEDE